MYTFQIIKEKQKSR